MAKEPKPPKPFSERDNPLLALLGRRTEEERFTQDQTDQVVDSFAVSAFQIQKTIGDVRENLSHAIQWAAETVAGQVVTLKETMVRMHTVLEGVQDSLMNPRPLMTKEQMQEQERRENSAWNRVFDFFGNAFSDLKDYFKVKKEWSWWELIKEAAFWITAVGLAYFWRFYKVVDTVIDAIRNVYNLIKQGRLVTAIKDYFKGITSALRGWVSNLFKTLREGVLTKVTSLFTRMWNLIKESKFFRLFRALGSDIARGFSFMFGKIRPVINFIVRELGLLLKEIRVIGATLRGGKTATTLVNFFARLGNAFDIAKASVTGAATKLISSVSSLFSRLSGVFTRFVTGPATKLVSSVSSLFSRLSGVFTRVYSTVSSFFQIVSASFASLFKSVTTTVNGITSVFSGIFSSISKTINLIAPATFAEVSAIFSSIVSKISSVFSFVKPAIDMIGGLFKSGGGLSQIFSIFSRVGSTLMRVGASVFNVLKSVGGFIVRFVPFVARLIKWVPVLGWVLTAIDGIIGAIKGFFASEGKGILERIGMVFQGIIAGIVSGLSLGFLEFDQIMGWFDSATDWLGDVFYKMYEFFTTTLPGFFTETIPNFFTETIPNFFAWLGSTIWNGVKKAAEIAWDAVTYPFVMIGDFFSNLVTDLQIMFAKIDLWIAEAMNIFGADEDDPAVIAAKQRIARLEGRIDDIPYDQLSPREQDARRQKERLRDMAVRQNNLTEIDRQVREDERRSLLEATRGGQTTMNVVTSTNAATTAVSTGKQPATESDPSLRRAAGNIPYYGAGI